MTNEKVLYTDGHEVTVTESFIKVKRSLYQLNGITKHGFYTIHPDRLIPFLILLTGGMMIVLGSFQMMPAHFEIKPGGLSIVPDMNAAALALGVAMLILAALLWFFQGERYAIWIVTAEGERNLVVSRKREYINQILVALNHAFLNLIHSHRRSEMTS